METNSLKCIRCKQLVSSLGPAFIVRILDGKITRGLICAKCAEEQKKLKK